MKSTLCFGASPIPACMSRDKSLAYRGCSSSRIPEGIYFQITAKLRVHSLEFAPLGRPLTEDLSRGMQAFGMKYQFMHRLGGESTHSFSSGQAPNSHVCQGINPSPIGAAEAANSRRNLFSNNSVAVLSFLGICPIGASIAWGFILRLKSIWNQIPIHA